MANRGIICLVLATVLVVGAFYLLSGREEPERMTQARTVPNPQYGKRPMSRPDGVSDAEWNQYIQKQKQARVSIPASLSDQAEQVRNKWQSAESQTGGVPPVVHTIDQRARGKSRAAPLESGPATSCGSCGDCGFDCFFTQGEVDSASGSDMTGICLPCDLYQSKGCNGGLCGKPSDIFSCPSGFDWVDKEDFWGNPKKHQCSNCCNSGMGGKYTSTCWFKKVCAGKDITPKEENKVKCCLNQILAPTTGGPNRTPLCGKGWCVSGQPCAKYMAEYAQKNGYDQNVQKYLQMIHNAPCGNSQTYAAQVVQALMDKWYPKGSKVQKGNPHNPKAVEICNLVAGACDQKLESMCSNVTSMDQIKDDQHLIQMCGCHAPEEFYRKYYQGVVSKECMPPCLYPNAVGQADNQGGTKQCTQANCVMDDITVNIINSTTGKIDFGQLCGGAQSSSNCWFSDNTINTINSQTGGIDFSQNCGQCWKYSTQGSVPTSKSISCRIQGNTKCHDDSDCQEKCPSGLNCSCDLATGYCYVQPKTGCQSDSDCPGGTICDVSGNCVHSGGAGSGGAGSGGAGSGGAGSGGGGAGGGPSPPSTLIEWVKKHRTWVWIGVGVLALLLILVVVAAVSRSRSGSRSPPPGFGAEMSGFDPMDLADSGTVMGEA